jgi:thymidylate synthase
MLFRRVSQLLALILLFAVSLSAQMSPTESVTEKEKKKKELENLVLEMIEQAVGDASTLKLAQNRAIVYGIAGDLLWKFDEKRARTLFRNSGNEIITANAEAEQQKKEQEGDPYFFTFESVTIRNEILPLIAKHDADLALELLVQTRPAQLSEAIAKAAQPNAKQDGGFMNFSPDRFRVQQEVALEQRFAVLAAEQNPDKAIKLIKDSLSKGISWNVMPLLQKLHQKDEKKASALADDVVRKILDADLTRNKEDLNAALRFLESAANPDAPKETKEKVFKFSDQHLKDIAGKIANTFLQPSNSLEMTMNASRAMPSLEKFAPERAVLLKQKQAEATKNLPPELRRMQERQKLWNPNSTPEEILAQIQKVNEFERASAYQFLTNKISQIEDETRAKKLIEQIPDEKARTNAAEQYEAARISRAAREGKLDEAKKMIGNLTQKKTQIQKLVALALEFHKKNTEKDRETAAALMRDAKRLANEFPEDEDELNNLMEIVRGYAVVDHEEAFRIFDPVVDQINDFVQASAILSKYNKRNRSFKKGELVLRTNGYSGDNLLLFRYISQIQLLGKADLNRMSSLSDRFQRADSRTIVKLYVAQGYLGDDKNIENSNATGTVVIIDE